MMPRPLSFTLDGSFIVLGSLKLFLFDTALTFTDVNVNFCYVYIFFVFFNRSLCSIPTYMICAKFTLNENRTRTHSNMLNLPDGLANIKSV